MDAVTALRQIAENLARINETLIRIEQGMERDRQPIMVEKKTKKPRGEKTPIAKVFDEYEAAFEKVHKHPPIRSAKNYAICGRLVKEIGFEDSMKLVRYFVTRTDAYYLNKAHKLELCLGDCQKLLVNMRNGTTVNDRNARTVSVKMENERMVLEYGRNEQR